MNRLEFKLIDHFDADEITATGSRLAAVDLDLMLTYDRFRDRIGLPVFFVKDGITTGTHKSKYHKEGKAGDSFIKGACRPQKVFEIALNVGFKGIGIYWNGKIISYHLDIGDNFRFWKGIKTPKQKSWAYTDLIVAPNG